MRLSGEQIRELAEFSDGDYCIVSGPAKGVLGNELITVITVTRIEDKERVRIYENGMVEAVR